MDALLSNLHRTTAEFSTILDRAAIELPQVTDTSTRIDGHWSRKQILGHLIDSAANNHQRFVRGQLDRELVSPSYAQKQWVETERFQDREWSDLVAFWLVYNRHLLHVMSHVASDRLNTIVRIGNDEPVTLEYVMIDYVRHMKHHLNQIGLAIE